MRRNWKRPDLVSLLPFFLDIVAYLEYRSRRTLRPLRVLLKSIQFGEGLVAQLCNSLLELRVEDIDQELVKE